LPDGIAIVRSSSSAVFYELADTLKTATTTVNMSSLALATRYYDPCGVPRGASPVSWPDQHGYLGKSVDPTTGLGLLGARQYDSALGRLLSVDPVLEQGDSHQMNGYSYNGDDPVNSSDPAGLWCDSCNDGSGWNTPDCSVANC
jgi:RHS repeat-associated protein